MNKKNNSNINKLNHNQSLFLVKNFHVIALSIILWTWTPGMSMINTKTNEWINNIINTDKKYEQKLLQIVNIDKVNNIETITKLLDSIKYRENKLDTLQVPNNLRLPLESVCLNPTSKTINIITKFRNIHYLPNIDFAYQLSLIYFEKLQEHWENTPTIPIILGLLSQETWIRNVYWDDGKSKWYGQLYFPTAEYLLKSRHKEIFSKYFYIKNNEVFFHGETKEKQQENMIRTTFDLLLLEKWYKKGNELIALAKYNGSSYNLNKYAFPVINKAANYSIFLTAMSENNFWYKESIWPIEYIFEQEAKKEWTTLTIFKDFFNQFVQETRLWRNNPKEYRKYNNKHIENNIDLFNKYWSYEYISFNKKVEGYPYIIPEKNKTIFSYFRENTREAIIFHNNVVKDNKDKINLFYYELINWKKTKKIITSKEEMIKKNKEGFIIYADQHKDKIYINLENKLYYYEWTEDRITSIYIDNLDKEKKVKN